MRVRVAHASLQFGDTDKQHTADIELIFDRCVDRKTAWVTGTEAGPGSGNTGEELIRVAREHGYKPWVPSTQSRGRGRATDAWLAVREDLVVSGWETNYIEAIPGSQQLYEELGLDPDLNPRWGPKGLVTAGFQSVPKLGQVNIGVAHHLTKGQNPKKSTFHGVDHYELNERLDETITEWMREVGRGPALAFFSTDRNASDKSEQVIKFGTTLADELENWQNTGHGPIDWMGSYDRDGRVTGHRFEVLDDSELRLHTDHFFLEGVYTIEPIKTA